MENRLDRKRIHCPVCSSKFRDDEIDTHIEELMAKIIDKEDLIGYCMEQLFRHEHREFLESQVSSQDMYTFARQAQEREQKGEQDD